MCWYEGDPIDCTYGITHFTERLGGNMPTEDSAFLPLAMSDGILFKRIDDTQPDVKDVIFNPPATVVLWDDGTKTVSKCSEDDSYEPRLGFLICVAKKYFGNGSRYKKVMEKFNVPDYGLVDIIRHQIDPDVYTTYEEEE